jgi:hypothetical protein
MGRLVPADDLPDMAGSNAVPASDLPGQSAPMVQEAPVSPTDGMSWLGKATAGFGKSFVDTARGMGQLIPGQYNTQQIPAGQMRVDPFVPAVSQQQVDDAKALDAPLMQTGGGVTGNISGQLAQFAVPGGAAVKGLTMVQRMARAAGIGAALANTQPVATGESRLTNTALGAAGGAAGEGLAAGVGAAARAASDTIDPAVAALAKRARQLGIPLRAEQVSKSRPLAGVSAALDMVPLSGREASREAQRIGFNRAVARTFGEDTPNLATAVRQAQGRLGDIYDEVLKTNPVKADSTFINDLDEVMKAARSELTDQQFGVMERQADNLLSKLQTGDTIDGQAAYNIKKMLDRIGKGQDTSLAHHATDLKNVLISALDRSLPADVGAQFKDTRKQYRNLIAVRKLVKAGAEGNVTPAGLGNAKNLAGDLKEVADIGAQFLKEPFGNSGTANRLVGAGVMGGLGTGAVFNPLLAAKAAAVGASAGRGANMALDSNWLQNYLMGGSPALKKMLPMLNSALPVAGTTAAVASQ